MEVAGLVVGAVSLAGLYNAALEVVNVVESYKNSELEARHLAARLSADKVTLQTWAHAVGITEHGLASIYDHRLNNIDVARAVGDILTCLCDLFRPPKAARGRLPSDTRALGITLRFDGAGGSLEHANTARKRDRVAWAFGVRRQFEAQVGLFGALVQKLLQLVPPENPATQVISISPNTSEEYTASTPVSVLLANVMRHFQEEDRARCLAWLGHIVYEDRYESCLKCRVPSTCEWIFEREPVKNWIRAIVPNHGARLLWIHGAAGFGKSVLCAKIIENLRKDHSVPVFYYLFPCASGTAKDPTLILRAWITQMVTLNPAALDLATIAIQGASGVAEEAVLWQLLAELLSQAPASILVTDGLDECNTVDRTNRTAGYESRYHFLRRIKDIIGGSNHRVLVVSRPEPDIRAQLSMHAPGMESIAFFECAICQEDVDSDILVFSKYVVDTRLSKKPSAFKDEVAAKVAAKSAGMFLWIDLQQTGLRNGKNKAQLFQAIEDTPMVLEAVYSRDWKRILSLPHGDQRRAINLLRWVTFATRPLTVIEITEALAVLDVNYEDDIADELPDEIDQEYVESEICSLSGTMLELRGTDPESVATMTLHLRHFSVEQFLTDTDARRQLSDVTRHSTSRALNNDLAIMCLRYLRCPSVVRSLEKGEPKYAFIDYAVQEWRSHMAPEGERYAEFINVANSFFSSTNTMWIWWRRRYELLAQTERNEDCTDTIIPPDRMYYAAYFGLKSIVDSLHVDNPQAVNTIGGIYGTPASAACYAGHSKLAIHIVELGGSLDISDGDYGTILCTACYKGDALVCRHVINSGADPNMSDKRKRTPLYIASKEGNLGIVQMLLENGGDLAIPMDSGWTPLLVAVYGGHIDIVQFLLDRGADLMVVSTDQWTALNIAASQGQATVARILLDRGADMSKRSHNEWTVTTLASYGGHLEVVELLLDYGADPSAASTKDGATPLGQGTTYGHADVMRVLLDRGADINASNDAPGTTLLHLAVISDSLEAVKLLLERGVQVDQTNDTGLTPLNTACEIGNLDMAQLLLRYSASTSIADLEGWTPLNSACEGGHTKLVQLLIDEHADLSIPNRFQCDPLKVAASNGNLNIARLLLRAGASLSSRDEEGNTALGRAALSGHPEIERLLLDHGANPVSADNDGFTPLHFACHKADLEVARLLLDSGADPTLATVDGVTPLQQAIPRSRELTRLILDRNADLGNALFSDGQTPLHLALRVNLLDIAELLLTKGADPLPITEAAESALHLACRWDGSAAIQERLVALGCDVHLIDCFGRTAYDWAVLDPDFDPATSSWAAGLTRTSESERQDVLQRSLAKAIRKSLAQPAAADVVFSILGFCLMFLGDEENALKAFQREVFEASGERMHYDLCCRCSAMPIKSTIRYICRSCAGTDLCEDCFVAHRADPQPRRCRDHQFLEVSSEIPLSDCYPLVGLNEEGFDRIWAWLRELQNRYANVDELHNTEIPPSSNSQATAPEQIVIRSTDKDQ